MNELKIMSFKFGELEFNENWQRVARILSGYRNMPYSFYVNRSNGVNAGFFINVNATFKECFEQITNNFFNRDVYDRDADNHIIIYEDIKEIFEKLQEIDPEQKYAWYKL